LAKHVGAKTAKRRSPHCKRGAANVRLEKAGKLDNMLNKWAA
jgi:hypothetical protein